MNKQPSERQTGSKSKPSVGDNKVGLGYSASRIRCRQSSEIDAIDIVGTGEKDPPRVVHHVNGVHADFELFPFGNPDPLHHGEVQVGVTWSFDPRPAKAADGSGSRLGKPERTGA